MFFFCTGLDVRSWHFFSLWFATADFHSWKTSMESHMFKVANAQKIPKKCCIENAFSLGANLSWSFHYFSLSTDCTFSRVLSLRTESWSVPQHVRHFPPHSWWAKSGRDAGKQWCRILNRATHNFGCICTSKWHEFIEDPEDVLVRKGWKLRGNTWTHFAMSVVLQDVSLNVPGEPVQQGPLVSDWILFHVHTVVVLLMEEILHHLGCIKPCKS